MKRLAEWILRNRDRSLLAVEVRLEISNLALIAFLRPEMAS